MTSGSGSAVRRMVCEFRPFLRGQRRLLMVAAVLLVVSAACDTAGIRLFADITDQALLTANLGRFWQLAAAWSAVAAVGGAASYGAGCLIARGAGYVLLQIRDTVHAHVQRLSPQFFQSYGRGDLVARLTADIESVEHVVSSGAVNSIGSLATVVFFAIAAVSVSWQLALAAAATAPLLWLAARFFSRKLQQTSQAERHYNGEISSLISEGLDTLALTQAHNQQHRERARLHHSGLAYLRAKVAGARFSSAYTPLIKVVQTVSELAVLAMGIWLIARHQLTLGGLMAVVSYLGYLYPPLQQLGTLALSVSSAAASAERISELLHQQPAVVETPQARALAQPGGHLVFERVTHTYPSSHHPAVRDLSLDIRPGQFVLVTGPSGAGKSTLATLAMRYVDPEAGRIVLDGHDLRELTLESLREVITFVPQETVLRQGTVRDNIATARPEATDEQIRTAAIAADADTFIQHLPHGYETQLHHRGTRLSGGQRQRLALAQALLRDTPVLLLDEPTTGLDTAASERVLQPLQRLAGNKTIVLISHDLSIAPLADTVAILDHGHLTHHAHHSHLPHTGPDHTPHLAGLTDPAITTPLPFLPTATPIAPNNHPPHTTTHTQ